MTHYKYSLSDIENMLPWEREIYIILLEEYVTEKNDQIKRQNGHQ